MADVSFNSANYFHGRERAERELADQAASITIRDIHLEMADRYRELAQEDQLKRTGQDRDLGSTKLLELDVDEDAEWQVYCE